MWILLTAILVPMGVATIVWSRNWAERSLNKLEDRGLALRNGEAATELLAISRSGNIRSGIAIAIVPFIIAGLYWVLSVWVTSDLAAIVTLVLFAVGTSSWVFARRPGYATGKPDSAPLRLSDSAPKITVWILRFSVPLCAALVASYLAFIAVHGLPSDAGPMPLFGLAYSALALLQVLLAAALRRSPARAAAGVQEVRLRLNLERFMSQWVMTTCLALEFGSFGLEALVGLDFSLASPFVLALSLAAIVGLIVTTIASWNSPIRLTPETREVFETELPTLTRPAVETKAQRLTRATLDP